MAWMAAHRSNQDMAAKEKENADAMARMAAHRSNQDMEYLEYLLAIQLFVVVSAISVVIMGSVCVGLRSLALKFMKNRTSFKH